MLPDVFGHSASAFSINNFTVYLALNVLALNSR